MNAHRQRRIDVTATVLVIVCFVALVWFVMPDRSPHRRPRCPAHTTPVTYAAGDGSGETTLRCMP